ncbi:MAG: alpha/beta fold hydrolase [Myxococcaceae bacterium]
MENPAHLSLLTDTGLKVHALAYGDRSRPVVLMLHGFPELSASWLEVMPYLRDAGFYVVAPDLRGYGGTDKPESGYDIDTLALDVVKMIDQLGRDRVHLVGHDWGGAIAYHVAAHFPDRVESLSVVNCPHPALMAKKMWKPSQLRRSWYMFFFQVPLLPEYALSREGGALVPRMLRSAAVDKRHFTRERLKPYAQNFSNRDTARAAVSYYREMFKNGLSPRGLLKFARYPKIKAPFRLIWGEEDVALGKELTFGMEPYFEQQPEVKYLSGVGHFSTIEAPEKVGPLIVEHVLS